MKIEMKKTGAWVINGKVRVFEKGQIVEATKELAEKIIAQGYGIPIEDEKLPAPEVFEESLVDSETLENPEAKNLLEDDKNSKVKLRTKIIGKLSEK